jgi:hypothetical protein
MAVFLAFFDIRVHPCHPWLRMYFGDKIVRGDFFETGRGRKGTLI